MIQSGKKRIRINFKERFQHIHIQAFTKAPGPGK